MDALDSILIDLAEQLLKTLPDARKIIAMINLMFDRGDKNAVLNRGTVDMSAAHINADNHRNLPSSP